MSSFSLDQVSEHDFALTKMDSRVVLTYVNIHLKRLFLEECHVKVVHFVFKAELGLVIWFETLAHLCGFRGMIVEIDSAESYEGSVGCLSNFGQGRHRLHNVLIELSIFHLKVHYVLVLTAFRLIGHS